MNRGEILLIHGAFVGGWVFERFRQRLSQAGWRTHAPDLPLHGPDAAGNPPHPDLHNLGLNDCREAIEAEITRLAQPPVLIGHSLGGLLALQLAARGLARAAILLAPVSPWGILPHSRYELESAAGLLLKGGAIWRHAMPPDFGIAQRYSLDRLAPALQRDVYSRMVPESGRILHESLLWWLDWHAASRLSFHRVTCPLLFMAGSNDRVTPAVTVRALAGHFPGRALYRDLPEMSHFLFGEPEEDMLFEHCLEWLSALS